MPEVQYIIAELREGETGGYAPRGAAKTLWQTRDFECFLAGPAETGKTWGCLQYADALLWKYAGAHGVMCRKTYASLVGTAVRTYLRVLGPGTPVRAFGGEQPRWFDYPNGSRLWLAGMDNPGKALSSERDFIYINQAEELALGDFETLTTRTTGRGAVMPYTRIFGDCNPGPPHHWIKARAAAGTLRLLESRHRDNPTLYDDAGRLTEQGKRTMSVLDALTGVRRLRLRDGKWAAAEGLVYEDFDAAVHVVPAADVPTCRRFVAGVDWGFTNPGVIGVWAVDGDERAYLVREIVRTRQTIGFWVATAKAIDTQYRPETFVCDPAEPAYIEQFRGAGLNVTEGFNDIEAGCNAVRERLKPVGDGRPRLFVSDAALPPDERDEGMVDARLPCGLVEEMGSYSYPKGTDGRPVKEKPVDKDNHSADAARYMTAYLDDVAGERVEFGGGGFVLGSKR